MRPPVGRNRIRSSYPGPDPFEPPGWSHRQHREQVPGRSEEERSCVLEGSAMGGLWKIRMMDEEEGAGKEPGPRCRVSGAGPCDACWTWQPRRGYR